MMNMPHALNVRDTDINNDLEYDPTHSLPMIAWAAYWRDNRDSSLSPWPKTNHILNERTGGSGVVYMDLMPVGVEYVDSIIAGLPWRVRLAAWCWWVANRRMSLRATADQVRHELRKSDKAAKYYQSRLEVDIATVAAMVNGQIAAIEALDSGFGDAGDEDNAQWWAVD